VIETDGIGKGNAKLKETPAREVVARPTKTAAISNSFFILITYAVLQSCHQAGPKDSRIMIERLTWGKGSIRTEPVLEGTEV
jgi:hypothetical protein